MEPKTSTDTAKAVTSCSWHLSAARTESAKAEDSTVNSVLGCVATVTRRNPVVVNLDTTSGAKLVFPSESERIHGHTVVLILISHDSRHISIICANAANFREEY